MGNFCVNFTTRGPDRDAVANSLRSAKRKAFVGPTLEGQTVFFDEKSDTQDDAIIKDLGKRVSKDLALIGPSAVPRSSSSRFSTTEVCNARQSAAGPRVPGY
jgi:hypothetical protein